MSGTSDADLMAAAQTLLNGIAERAAAIVMAQIQAGGGTTTQPSSGGNTGGTTNPPSGGDTGGTTLPTPTSQMTVVAAAEAKQGMSARFTILFPSTPGTDTLTLGGNAEDSDFDWPILTAVQRAAARYPNVLSVAINGSQAAITWKAGAPAKLAVATNCRVYHRRGGDRSISLTTSAGTATMALRNNMPAKNSLADFQTDYPGMILWDGKTANTALTSVQQQALASMACHTVFVAGKMLKTSNWSTAFALQTADGSSTPAQMGILDDSKFGWRVDGAVQKKQPLAANSVMSFTITEWTQNYRTNGGELDYNYDFLPKATTINAGRLGVDTSACQLQVCCIVPYPLSVWEEQKLASLLAAQAGLPAITPWPLLCDITSTMTQAPYHNPCLTAADHSIDPEGFNHRNYRGEFNGHGCYHTLSQEEGFAPYGDAANKQLQAQCGVPDLIVRNDDPAGGLLLNTIPCPAAFKPYTVLSAANADETGQYSVDDTGNPVAKNGADFLVAHIDTFGPGGKAIYAQEGGAMIQEFKTLNHPELGGYMAGWHGATSGWPPELDNNESGVFGGAQGPDGKVLGQPKQFGSYNYYRPDGSQRNSCLYRVQEWLDGKPAQTARVFTKDGKQQCLFVNGVAVSPWFAMDTGYQWFHWLNLDAGTTGGLGMGKQPPAGYTDQAMVQQVRNLQY